MRIFAYMKRPIIPNNGRIIEAVARRFRVLGDPQRLRILQLLESGEKTVGSLAALLAANQPNVSRHLQALFSSGLVERRKSGSRVTYSVSDPAVFELCRLVCSDVVEQARADMAELAAAEYRPKT